MMPERYAPSDKEKVPDVQILSKSVEKSAISRINCRRDTYKRRRTEAPKMWKTKTYDLINAGPEHRFSCGEGGIVAQCNFGYLYGMSHRSFVGYAKTQYGVDFTEQEALEVKEGFFDTYSGLEGWHNEVREFVMEHGYVRSYSGRVRHLPNVWSEERWISEEAVRQGVNCLSDDTEILTMQGWKTVYELATGDAVISVNPATGLLEGDTVSEIHLHEVDQDMHHFTHNSVSAVATPNHRWLIDHKGNKNEVSTRFRESGRLRFTGSDRIWIACEGMSDDCSTEWTDDEVTLMGWVLTDGYYIKQTSGRTGKPCGFGRVGVTQVKKRNLQGIGNLFSRLGKHGYHISKAGQHFWAITCDAGYRMRRLMPDKIVTAEVLMSMSHSQRLMLYSTMLAGDGSWDSEAGRYRRFTCATEKGADAFLILCALIGQGARAKYRDMSSHTPKLSAKMKNVPKRVGVWIVELVVNKRAQVQYGHEVKQWKGIVWCPTTRNGTWIAKRNGKVFITGNSPIQEFASSLSVIAISRMMKEIDQGILQINGFIHDAVYATVPPEYVEWGMKTIKYYMESNPIEKMFGVKLKLPIVADAEFGMNAADTYEASGLKLGHDYNFKKLFKEEVAYIKDDDKMGKKERTLKVDTLKRFRDTIVGEQCTPASGGRIVLPKYLR